MKKVVLLNTAIVTNLGKFEVKEISLEEAKKLVKKNDFVSAIGHQSTAEILTTLLNSPVEMNRLTVEQQEEVAVRGKRERRGAEGRIWSAQEIEEIGYEFLTMERFS